MKTFYFFLNSARRFRVVKNARDVRSRLIGCSQRESICLYCAKGIFLFRALFMAAKSLNRYDRTYSNGPRFSRRPQFNGKTFSGKVKREAHSLWHDVRTYANLQFIFNTFDARRTGRLIPNIYIWTDPRQASLFPVLFFNIVVVVEFTIPI